MTSIQTIGAIAALGIQSAGTVWMFRALTVDRDPRWYDYPVAFFWWITLPVALGVAMSFTTHPTNIDAQEQE